ncbi:MAG: ABC transporter ATP-binding protein [Bacilli bacterium]|nr:ABC transporter ATP-binding protein [Bacilli bacterium]
MKGILKKYIKSFVVVALLILIRNIFSVLHPYVVKQIVDVDFKLPNITNVILKLFLTYLAIHIVLVIIKNITNTKTNKLMTSLLRDIREKLFCKILKFKMKTYNKYNSSEIYTRLTADVDNLSELFFGILQIFINNVLYITFMVVMMFLANINLALIGAFTIVIVSLVSILFVKVLKRLDKRILFKRDKENKEFSEMYNKNKLTYLFSLQKNNLKKVNKLFDEELKTRRKYIFVHHFMYPASLVLESLGIYAILYYALNINMNFSLGDIYLVLFYIKQCRSPLTQMFDKMEEIQTCFNSLKKINNILNEKDDEEIFVGDNIQNLNGDIEFKNVCMKYSKEEVLKDISFVIKKGEKVTIAGKTGVGKTTLTNVFMRMYDINSGKILIDGHDISKISIKSLRNDISYISQTPYIFEDTIRNNITLGDSRISDNEIISIIDEIGVRSTFNNFKNGLNECIKASSLSYGELQVIAFIRAIVHKANIYIFDEPTSNIDLKTEKMIQNLIDKISKDSTVIIVAHRKSTLNSSDKIIYLKDGYVDKVLDKVLDKV